MARCGAWACGGKLIATSMVAMVAGLSISARANADEADAKKTLKSMSVYMANQKTISFSYDASLEFVTNTTLALSKRVAESACGSGGNDKESQAERTAWR